MRNVYLLACAQALGMSSASMMIFIGGILGQRMAPDPSWATMPVAFVVVGAATASVPASFIMKRFGRKAGFLGAACWATIGALVAAYSVSHQHFYGFLLGAFMLGNHMAFVQQYRFAAAESVAPERISKAISLVLVGGIAAAVIGPTLGSHGTQWFHGNDAGAFIALSLCLLGVIGILSFFRNPVLETTAQSQSSDRPLTHLLRSPAFILAVTSALSGYALMSLIMTATPLHMHTNLSFDLAGTAIVIQSHVAAMFIPSLISGWLISRLGEYRFIAIGIALFCLCIGILLAGNQYGHFLAGLILLGLAWNATFVAGTSLLTKSYRDTERFKAQAINEGLVFGGQATASLLAGVMLAIFGWQGLLWLCVPVILLTTLVWAWASLCHARLAR